VAAGCILAAFCGVLLGMSVWVAKNAYTLVTYGACDPWFVYVANNTTWTMM
jgi:hypothetical protein